MKVRLKLTKSISRTRIVTSFQFHEGPIKTMLQKQQDWSERSFNSMKVRLKHYKSTRKKFVDNEVSIP